MQAFYVDLDLLDESVAELARGGEALDDVLAEVARRVAELHGTWVGDAASAQQVAQEAWTTGAEQMRDGLAAMRAAAAGAHSAYTAAIDANLRMWGRVG